MVQGGLGVAFLPSEDFHSHTLSGVREIKLKERIVKEVGVAWRRDAASPPGGRRSPVRPGVGQMTAPLLFLFSPCPSCCIIEPFH